MLETFLLIVLPIALGNGQPIIHIIQPHSIVGDVSNEPAATAPDQTGGLLRVRVRPDFDARALGRVVHAHVEDQDVLDVVDARGILAQTADGDAVRAVAVHVADGDVGAIGLEADAVYSPIQLGSEKDWKGLTVAIVHGRVLNGDPTRSIRVPAVGILFEILIIADRVHVDIVEHNVRRVHDDIMPERRAQHLQIRHRPAMQARRG